MAVVSWSLRSSHPEARTLPDPESGFYPEHEFVVFMIVYGNLDPRPAQAAWTREPKMVLNGVQYVWIMIV